MKEIELKNNSTGLRVFINGIPNLKLLPKDESEIIINALELHISEFYKKSKVYLKIKK